LTVTIASEHVDTTLQVNARLSNTFYGNFIPYGIPIGMLVEAPGILCLELYTGLRITGLG
ncbi:MAG: hypothetical protein LBD91_01520, partial [Prevotellaceae bacterium]|nr:hypothetical protein [Prevotellaceae bacterium]